YVTRIGDRLPSSGRIYALLRDVYGTLAKLPLLGGTVLPHLLLAYRKAVRRTIEYRYLPLFEPHFRELKVDVVVGHDLPMLPVAAAAAKACDAHLVYDSHELFSEQLMSASERRHLADVEARYIAAADRVITVNSSIARELESRYTIGPVA